MPMEYRLARRAEREAFLAGQMEPGEVVVARSRREPLVTDRRMLFARQLRQPPRSGEWVAHSIAFSEVTHWRSGQTHDERPILELEHPAVAVIGHVPEHRFLWFEWGNAEEAIEQTTTTLRFPDRRDPAFIAIRDRLEREGVPQGKPFAIRPPGTREGRLGGGVLSLKRWGRAGRRGPRAPSG